MTDNSNRNVRTSCESLALGRRAVSCRAQPPMPRSSEHGAGPERIVPTRHAARADPRAPADAGDAGDAAEPRASRSFAGQGELVIFNLYLVVLETDVRAGYTSESDNIPAQGP